MFPAVSLSSFRGSDVMTQANLELLQDELLRHPFKFCELDPCEVPHLAVAQEFLIRFANDHGATFCTCKGIVDEVLRCRNGGRLKNSTICVLASRVDSFKKAGIGLKDGLCPVHNASQHRWSSVFSE